MTTVDGPECRSSYYTDTGRRQDLGDREVRCTLPVGHDGDHEEWFDAAGGLLATWKPLAPTPRTWSLPPEPGPEVTAVRDCDGELWLRGADDLWHQHDGECVHAAGAGGDSEWRWVLPWGPLTDATGEQP